MCNEWSKTTAKNARVDARERHLWLVRKGGIPRGVSICDRGVPAYSGDTPTEESV
jgi:hypothetical protein